MQNWFASTLWIFDKRLSRQLSRKLLETFITMTGNKDSRNKPDQEATRNFITRTANKDFLRDGSRVNGTGGSSRGAGFEGSAPTQPSITNSRKPDHVWLL